MAWNFLAQLAFYVGTYVVSALLDKSTRPATPAPGEVQFPKADPDAPIPVIYGTTRVGINVVHKVRVTTGVNTVRGAAPFGWSQQQVGYFYYLDALAIVGWGPLGAIHDVIVDGTKSLATLGSVVEITGFATGAAPLVTTTDTLTTFFSPTPPFYFFNREGGDAITVTAGNILGGKFSRGGVGAGSTDAASSGTLRVFPGTGSPVHSAAFEAIHGGDLPCYPKLITLGFEDNFYLGNTDTLPAIELVVSRSVAPFGGTGYMGNVTANGGADANPALILYDLLTNTDYGLGLPPSDIDTTSFSVLAGALDTAVVVGAAFDFGLSFVLTERSSGKDIIADLLRTLDGAIYLSPDTGQLRVRLLRGADDAIYGYTPGSTVVDASDIIDGTFTWSESAADALVNEVKVEFIDRDRNYAKNVVTVKNAAAIHALGRTESRTTSFLGVQNMALATRLAQRELKALSAVLGRGSFEMTRRGYSLTPGQPFTLTHALIPAGTATVRVVSVRDTPHGTVLVDVVEDVYASEAPSFDVEDTPEPTPLDDEAYVVPVVVPELTYVTGGVWEKLYIYDPQNRVTAIEFAETSNGGTWHAANNPPPPFYVGPYSPYFNEVGRQVAKTEKLMWRVTYTAPDGTDAYLIGEFPDLEGYRRLPPPVLRWEQSGSTITVTATWTDAETADLYLYSSLSAFQTYTPGDSPIAGTYTISFPAPASGEIRYVSAVRRFATQPDDVTQTSEYAFLTIPGTSTDVADVLDDLADTIGQIGIPIVFLTVPENDHWLALSTIPTAEAEVGTEFRRQRYLVGAGSVRLHANVKAITGTPTLRLHYTTNAFGATTQLLSWTPSGTGLQSSGWVAVPSGAKADVGLTVYVGDGADTAALDLYALDAEFLPTTVSGARIHTPAFAPAFV